MEDSLAEYELRLKALPIFSFHFQQFASTFVDSPPPPLEPDSSLPRRVLISRLLKLLVLEIRLHLLKR